MRTDGTSDLVRVLMAHGDGHLAAHKGTELEVLEAFLLAVGKVYDRTVTQAGRPLPSLPELLGGQPRHFGLTLLLGVMPRRLRGWILAVQGKGMARLAEELTPRPIETLGQEPDAQFTSLRDSALAKALLAAEEKREAALHLLGEFVMWRRDFRTAETLSRLIDQAERILRAPSEEAGTRQETEG